MLFGLMVVLVGVDDDDVYRKHQAEGPAKAKGIIEKMVDNRIVVNTGLGLLLFSAVFGVTLIQHRYILRLTQVRYRQAPATGTSGEARNVIRMTTAMHRSKVPGIKGPVEYPLEEVKVRMIDREYWCFCINILNLFHPND